jgi:hypothetical protein
MRILPDRRPLAATATALLVSVTPQAGLPVRPVPAARPD